MRRSLLTALAQLGALGALSSLSCTSGGTPELRAEAPAVGANPGSSAALYVELFNDGGSDDALLGASCACAERTSLHVTEDRDGILMMLGADELELPSHRTVELHPGGSHIMLEGLREPLEAGSTLEISLEFAQNEPITLEVPVVPLADLAERVPEQ